MNDGSYHTVSTITREQAPKEASSQYSRHSREFLWKEKVLLFSQNILVAIIFVEMKSEGTETLLAQNRLWKNYVSARIRCYLALQRMVLTFQMIITFA